MKAYKVTLLIVDHDGVGDEIPTIIENQKFPNYCIAPRVMEIVKTDIGEWDDDHPFNKLDQQKEHFKKVFGN